jgi:hypothetical protein
VIAAQAEKFAAQDDPRPCCGHANRFHDDVAFAEGVEAHACVHCAWLSAREDAERYKDALNRIIGVPLGTSAEARKVWDIATSALDPAPPAPAPAKPRRMMPNDVTIHCSVEHDEDEYCRLNGCKPIGGENA